VVNIKIRGHLQLGVQANQTATDVFPHVRLALVQDKQTNAAQLNAEDVFSSAGAGNATLMWQNPAFFGRFKILKDKSFRMPQAMVTWDGTNIEQNGYTLPFKWNITFKKPVVVHFNGTNGGTVADTIDNSFHVIGNSTNALAVLSYKCRTTFLDQ